MLASTVKFRYVGYIFCPNQKTDYYPAGTHGFYPSIYAEPQCVMFLHIYVTYMV